MAYLKKQTQFPKEQISVKSVLVMVYEILCKRRPRENKAKQSQFQDIGLGAVWIPAFAGMTNVEFLDGGKF